MNRPYSAKPFAGDASQNRALHGPALSQLVSTAKQPTRIAFVGHAVWDHVFMVPHLNALPGKYVASGYACRPGGMSANAALAAQRVRASDSPQVLLAAPMGDDEPGQALQAALAEAGVLLQPECVVPGARTGVSAVLVDAEGERQGHNVRSNAHSQSPLPKPEWFDTVCALQVDPRWPAGARATLALARARGIVSLLDADVAPREVLQDLATRADWVVFSSDGLRCWAGDEHSSLEPLFAQACTALPDAQLAVTLGAQGLLWRASGMAPQTLAAYPVRAVNTNGAGDALHGALLLALAEGQDAESALRFGMAAAACSVAGEAFGRDDVLARLRGPAA